jgi:SagB-type dehydrogenase family enzyme
MGVHSRYDGQGPEAYFPGARSPSRRPFVALAAILTLITAETCMADQGIYRLPQPPSASHGGLTGILQERRTTRAFAPQPLSLAEAARLLWAAQGISSPQGLRTAPSAGALYPLELHLVAGNVAGLASGHYRYVPAQHALQAVQAGDMRRGVAQAALDQAWVAEAPAVVVVTAIDSRTTAKYGPRGVRYVHMEVGHASQNLLLQAVALGLGAAVVGAFDDVDLKQLLRLPGEEHPLAILPVGHPRSQDR